MELRNRAPFAAGFVVLFDGDAAERLTLAVRGVWGVGARGTLTIADPQPPLSPMDTFNGEPGVSSIRHEADLGPPKLATDVALVGSAVASGSGTTRMEVTFCVGSLVQRAVVVGERRSFGDRPSAPRSFERVPLLWELAAGGTDATPDDERQHGMDLRNPVGRGFRAKGSRLPREGALLPQILSATGKEGEPVGFGFIGEHWQPRRQYGGTYDEVWREKRCPLLPLDFDPRFHNKAAPGLVSGGHLGGGEAVEVRGCTPEGVLRFALPSSRLEAAATLEAGPEPIALALAGVTVDCDAMELRVLWRGDLRVHGRLPRLRHVDVKLEGPAA